MKSNTLLPLALALSVALFATACNRKVEETPAATPAATTEPATAEPAPMEPAPAPAPATAEPTAAAVDSGMTFAAMDKNGDGGITHDELADTEMLHVHFSAADTDGDGKLSSAEVDAHRAAMAAAPAG